MRRSFGVLSVFFFALASGCEDPKNHVRLEFGDSGSGVTGFTCREATVPFTPLINRAFPGGPASPPIPAFAVVDFIRLGADPGCRINQILDWCAAYPCQALPSYRKCFPVDLSGVNPDAGPDALRTQLAAAAEASLVGAKVTGDAPDEVVMVRMVATVQNCGELGGGAPFDPARLLGCVYSAPVQLDSVHGSLFLGMDAIGSVCTEPAVQLCASGDIRP